MHSHITGALRALAVALALLTGAAHAHEGHDHGAPPPPVSKTIAPRGEAASEAFELVAIPRDGTLTLYLDRFRTGEPITDASLEVDTPDGPKVARPTTERSYVLPARAPCRPLRIPKGDHTMKTSLCAALIGAAALAAPAWAEDHGSHMQSAVKLPEACKVAAQAGGKDSMIKDMQSHMAQAMQGMPAQTGETQKGLQQAMMGVHGPMMQGAMAGDADVAWICAMIPHHQGAINMARAGLKGADNPESKRLAEETIQSQEKEIAKLTAWLEKNAKKEGNQ